MMEIFTPAIIAATTSLALSLITLFQFFKSQRNQQLQFEKSISRNLTTKLYDLRLEHYPRAYDITDKIYLGKGKLLEQKKIKETLDELINWKKGVINLIISVECRDSYFTLRNALMKNPEEKDCYSNQQIDKIKNAAKIFRKQLRRDLGYLYQEEKARRRKS